MNEKTLNSFLSSNLDKLGLVHVNSEVPKKLPSETKKPDIIAYDRESCIPVFLELKVARNRKVISQVCEYLDKIPSVYPNIMEELAAFRLPETFEFNYDYGIVGLIISPDPPLNVNLQTTHSIVWGRYQLSQNRFRISEHHVLSLSKAKPTFIVSRPNPTILRPSTLVKSQWPRLQQFSEIVNDAFLSVSQSIYLRPNDKINYIAYYTTNGTYAIFGIYTGKNKATFSVNFHIRKQHADQFLLLPEINTLTELGIPRPSRQDKGKYFIFSFVVNEQIVRESIMANSLVDQFKRLGEFSFSLERDTTIDEISVSEENTSSLSRRHFGITL